MNWNLVCCICKKDIEPLRDKEGHIHYHGGHNPSPITDEPDKFCCQKCNDKIVFPARMTELQLEYQQRRKK